MGYNDQVLKTYAHVMRGGGSQHRFSNHGQFDSKQYPVLCHEMAGPSTYLKYRCLSNLQCVCTHGHGCMLELIFISSHLHEHVGSICMLHVHKISMISHVYQCVGSCIGYSNICCVDIV